MITQRRKTGNLGEEIATRYLIKKGYLILGRNFNTKLGEIDVIALKFPNSNDLEIGNNKEMESEIRKFPEISRLNNKEMDRGTLSQKIGNNKENRKFPISRLLKKGGTLVFVEVKSGKYVFDSLSEKKGNRAKDIRSDLSEIRKASPQLSKILPSESSALPDAGDVLHETGGNIRPEENVHYHKMRHTIKAAQMYLAYKNLPLDVEWQIDVIALDLDCDAKKARLRHLEQAELGYRF